MNKRPIFFVDPYERGRVPPSVWLTRSAIVGAIAGVAASLHLLGYL